LWKGIWVQPRCMPAELYSRSPKNPALQQLQKSSKSASTTPQRPIWNYFVTVGVQDFSENGCIFTTTLVSTAPALQDMLLSPTIQELDDVARLGCGQECNAYVSLEACRVWAHVGPNIVLNWGCHNGIFNIRISLYLLDKVLDSCASLEIQFLMSAATERSRVDNFNLVWLDRHCRTTPLLVCDQVDPARIASAFLTSLSPASRTVLDALSAANGAARQERRRRPPRRDARQRGPPAGDFWGARAGVAPVQMALQCVAGRRAAFESAPPRLLEGVHRGVCCRPGWPATEQPRCARRRAAAGAGGGL